MDFQFITTSGDPRSVDSHTKKQIRSHVMKRHRQSYDPEERREKRRRIASKMPGWNSVVDSLQSEQNKETYASFSPTFDEDIDDLETRTDTLEMGVLRTPDLLSGFGMRWDPFESLCIPSTPRIHMLLHYNQTEGLRTSVHGNHTKYRSICMDDPAWIFMHISYASERVTQPLCSGNSESLGYVSQSISAVNKMLSSSPKQIRDSTIATVSCLANMENLNGSEENALIHMRGLQRMVESRGGLDGLGIGVILRRQVLWSDLLIATRCQRPPLFPLQSCGDIKPLSTFTSEKFSGSYELSLGENLIFMMTHNDQTEILEILKALHEIVTFLNFTSKNELPWNAAFPDRVYIVEHAILVCLAGSSNERLQKSDIWMVLLNASLLYIYTNIRETPTGGVIRGRLVSRLRDVLLNVEMDLLIQDYPEELLWVLCIGTYASINTEHEDWYWGELKTYCQKKEISDWEDFSDGFQSLPALETCCLLGCRIFGQKIFGCSHRQN